MARPRIAHGTLLLGASTLLLLAPATLGAPAHPQRGSARRTPAAYPSPAAIAAAGRFLDTRAGSTAFAVIDSSGRLHGLRTRERFQTASVVK